MELKNGETFNGQLSQCDTFMNLLLTSVIVTSRDGTRFFDVKEVYIKGNNIKYLRIPDEIIQKVKEDSEQSQKHFQYQLLNSQHNRKSFINIDL